MFTTKNKDKITESLKHFSEGRGFAEQDESLAIELIENEHEVNVLNQHFLTEVQQST